MLLTNYFIPTKYIAIKMIHYNAFNTFGFACIDILLKVKIKSADEGNFYVWIVRICRDKLRRPA